jgi:hypothetical protein
MELLAPCRDVVPLVICVLLARCLKRRVHTSLTNLCFGQPLKHQVVEFVERNAAAPTLEFAELPTAPTVPGAYVIPAQLSTAEVVANAARNLLCSLHELI